MTSVRVAGCPSTLYADTFFDAAEEGNVDLVQKLLDCNMVQVNTACDDVVSTQSANALIVGSVRIQEGVGGSLLDEHPTIVRYFSAC